MRARDFAASELAASLPAGACRLAARAYVFMDVAGASWV